MENTLILHPDRETIKAALALVGVKEAAKLKRAAARAAAKPRFLEDDGLTREDLALVFKCYNAWLDAKKEKRKADAKAASGWREDSTSANRWKLKLVEHWQVLPGQYYHCKKFPTLDGQYREVKGGEFIIFQCEKWKIYGPQVELVFLGDSREWEDEDGKTSTYYPVGIPALDCRLRLWLTYEQRMNGFQCVVTNTASRMVANDLLLEPHPEWHHQTHTLAATWHPGVGGKRGYTETKFLASTPTPQWVHERIQVGAVKVEKAAAKTEQHKENQAFWERREQQARRIGIKLKTAPKTTKKASREAAANPNQQKLKNDKGQELTPEFEF